MLLAAIHTSLAPMALAQTAPPASAGADTDAARRSEAFERFERGVSLYREGNYSAALSEFKAAYELTPTYRLLYNIGEVQFQLGDYVAALRAFEQYLAEGKDEITATRRAEIETVLQTLHSRISRLEVATSVEGATIAVDDVPMGKSPLTEPVTVGVGRHKVTATKQGYSEVTRYVDIAGARTSSVKLELVQLTTQETAQEATQEAVAPIEAPPARMTTLSWVGVAVAGVFAATAVGTGVAALDAKSNLDDKPPSDPGAGNARSRVKTFALATDILTGAALVTLGSTLAFTFLPTGSSQKTDRSDPPRRATRFVGVFLGARSVSASFVF